MTCLRTRRCGAALCASALAQFAVAGASNDECTGATVVAVPSATDDSTDGMGGDATPLCGGGGCVPAPGIPNDCCVDATPIGEVTDMPFDTTGANGDGPNSCVGINGHDVWFLYTATCDGRVRIDLCGSTFDTALAVYDGANCGAAPLMICNDDDCGLQSGAVIPAVSGNSYLIQIGGFAGAMGTGDLTIVCEGTADCGRWPCADSLRGDSNCDGAVDNGDIDCFVQSLLDLSGVLWQACALAVNPSCEYDYVCTNDLNGDGVVDTADIDSFVACIVSPPDAGQSCPEWDPMREDEPNCGVPVDTVDGGCGSNPPVFLPIECGRTYCGTAGAQDEDRDTDWYEIVLARDIVLTWSVEAAFPVLIGVAENFGVPDCNEFQTLRVFERGPACATVSVSTCVPRGTWWLFVMPDTFSGVDCGANYLATLTCDLCGVPRGACCRAELVCTIETEIDCGRAGGVYQGDETNCSIHYAAEACADSLIDIRGTQRGPIGNNTSAVVPLGFAFPFYGNSYSSVSISTNGYLQFGASSSDATNDPIPHTSSPNNIVCPMWDDWLNNDLQGEIWYATVGTDFVVWWRDVEHVAGGIASFQAILHGETGCIEFRYGQCALVSPSVGVENGNGDVGTAIVPQTALAAGCYRLCPMNPCP